MLCLRCIQVSYLNSILSTLFNKQKTEINKNYQENNHCTVSNVTSFYTQWLQVLSKNIFFPMKNNQLPPVTQLIKADKLENIATQKINCIQWLNRMEWFVKTSSTNFWQTLQNKPGNFASSIDTCGETSANGLTMLRLVSRSLSLSTWPRLPTRTKRNMAYLVTDGKGLFCNVKLGYGKISEIWHPWLSS